jgi:hypothetical protein
MFDEEDNYRDVSVQGDCDKVVLELAAMLGWKVRSARRRIEAPLIHHAIK